MKVIKLVTGCWGAGFEVWSVGPFLPPCPAIFLIPERVEGHFVCGWENIWYLEK